MILQEFFVLVFAVIILFFLFLKGGEVLGSWVHLFFARSSRFKNWYWRRQMDKAYRYDKNSW